METLVGFAVGFLVGTREGKQGIARIRASLAAIRDSADVRQIVGEAATALAPVVREVARSTGGRAA
jgi:hypothetical protein